MVPLPVVAIEFATAIFLISAWAIAYWVYRKGPNLARVSTTSAEIAEATISRQLVPRLDPWIVGGDRLVIVGSDGLYHAFRSGEFWTAALTSWLERGCKIEYVLTDGRLDSLGPLKDFGVKFRDLFTLYILEARSELAQRYATRHPVLLTGHDGVPKVLWLEAYHPRDHHIAYGVTYVAPDDASKSTLIAEVATEVRGLLSSIFPVSETSLLHAGGHNVAA